jgi:hypothetical protein
VWRRLYLLVQFLCRLKHALQRLSCPLRCPMWRAKSSHSKKCPHS